MALHEHFREYTAKELTRIKEKVCIAHKCPYMSRIWNGQKGAQISTINRTCNYIDMTGKMRGCMPDECKHWKDKNVKHKRISDNDIPIKKKDYVYIE